MSGKKTLLTIEREDLVKMAVDRKRLNIFALKEAKVPGAIKIETSALIEEILKAKDAAFEKGGTEAVAEAVKSSFEETKDEVKEDLPTAVVTDHPVAVPIETVNQIELLRTLHEKVQRILSMLEEGIRVVDTEDDEIQVAETGAKTPPQETAPAETVVEDTSPKEKEELPNILRGNLQFILSLAKKSGALHKVEPLKGDIMAMRRALISHLEEQNYFTN